jgi:hypothetical protein
MRIVTIIYQLEATSFLGLKIQAVVTPDALCGIPTQTIFIFITQIPG